MIMQIRRFHFFPKKSLNLKRQWSNLGSQDILLGVMHSYWWIYIATLWFWVQGRCKNFQLLVVRDMGWSPEHDKERKVVFASSLSYILMPRCNKVIIRHKITFLWTLLGCYVTNLFINQFVLSWGYHHFHATLKNLNPSQDFAWMNITCKEEKTHKQSLWKRSFPLRFSASALSHWYRAKRCTPASAETCTMS